MRCGTTGATNTSVGGVSLNSNTIEKGLTIEKGNNLILKDDDYTSNGKVIYERNTTISRNFKRSSSKR